MENLMKPQGTLAAKVIRGARGPLSWRIRNVLRWSYFTGWLGMILAILLRRYFGALTAYAELRAVLVRANGEKVNYGVLSRHVVTDAGVAFLVDDMDNNTTNISTFNFHGVGTGTTAEAAGQTALVTESTTALNPDSTRATGTKTQPTANQLRSTATVSFDASANIAEHGLLSQAATGGGTLWDRSVFTAIPVESGDGIQFQYTVTFPAGG